uniref:Protein kinase C-binding protein 1 n=3 Tax=Cacopsylla melanoneura TaxID=428564 RepID=A0A8D9BDI8_9HEMI
MEPSPDSSKEKPRKRSSHYSEWVEKALAEGGSRKRTSKKVSNPDFVDTDVALKTSETKESDGEVGTEELPDLDYENMSHYEKFTKYKKEYKAYRLANNTKKTKLSIDSSSLDAVEVSPMGQDESNSSISTKEHEDETTSVSEENSSQADIHTEQLLGASKKQTEMSTDQATVNNKETDSDPTELNNDKAENSNNQIKEAITPTTTPKEKVRRRGRPRVSHSRNRQQRSSSRQSSDNESHSKSRSRSRQSETNPTRRESSGRRPIDITPRQSSRFQKKLAEQTVATSSVVEDETDHESMETDVDVEGAIAPSNKSIIYLDKDKYCWFCHKGVTVTSHDRSNDFHRCRTCQKIFHVRCVTEFVIKTEWVVNDTEWECKPCVQYREYKEKDQWAPYVEYLGHDKYKKQLRFIIEKLKKYPSAKELLRPVNTRLFPDYPQYIARPIHFEMIDQRLNDGEYRCVDTLLEDIRWMVHNSVIFNGGSSGITKDLRSLLKNLRMELYDLDSCACCYIHAYTRPELWFVLPCPTPHLLVWAQLKGFPYWPAKVYDSGLEKRPGEILVKFFGDHARSWILYENIYLYSLDPPSECPNKRKKSKQHDMISSLMEMERHVEFLEKEFSVFKYPEQDILIGGNPEERALQLKYMIPLCGSKAEATKPPTDTPHTKPVALEPIKLDVKDARSKRNMLTMLEERLQQSRSDSEDSVKSGKISKEKDKKVVKASEYKEMFRQQERANSSKHSSTPRETTGNKMRPPSNTQRGARCMYLFNVLERKLRRDKKKQMKRIRLLKGAKKNNNQAGRKEDNNENTTNKSSTCIEANTAEAHESGNEKVDESGANKSPVSAKFRLSEHAKKPNCGDIDSFIESHLASSQQTSDWDGDRIPPILTPRDKRVTRAQLVVIQSEEERKLESENNDEQENKDNTKHGKSDEKPEESETPSKQGDGKNDSKDNKGNKEDRFDKVSADQADAKETKKSSKETATVNETKPEAVDENKKKSTRELKKMSQLSSLRLKRRLFRHKNYTAQLFQFRKLQNTFPRTVRNKQEDSVHSVLPDISKFFDVSKAEIKNPVVNLISITVEEIKKMKRAVKKSKTIMRCNKKKPQGSLISSEDDSGIVPIEDTMRISTESEDLTMDCAIDSVASGILSNDYWDVHWKDLASLSKSATPAGPPSSSSRPSRPASSVPFPEYLDAKRRPDRRNVSPHSLPHLDLKLRPDLFSHKQHVNSIVDYLKISGNDENSFAKGMTRVNLKKLESMAEMLVGLKNQNQISVDTQYNTALNSAELVLYSQYASTYPLPELSSTDYDEQFVPSEYHLLAPESK